MAGPSAVIMLSMETGQFQTAARDATGMLQRLENQTHEAGTVLDQYGNVARSAGQGLERTAEGAQDAAEKIERSGQAARAASGSFNRIGRRGRNFNQVLFSMGDGIQDAQFGMRGMGNNIAFMSEQLVEASRGAGGFTGVMKGLGSAMLGAGGAIVAIQLLITLGPKLVDMFSDSANAAKEAQKAFEDAFDAVVDFESLEGVTFTADQLPQAIEISEQRVEQLREAIAAMQQAEDAVQTAQSQTAQAIQSNVDAREVSTAEARRLLRIEERRVQSLIDELGYQDTRAENAQEILGFEEKTLTKLDKQLKSFQSQLGIRERMRERGATGDGEGGDAGVQAREQAFKRQQQLMERRLQLAQATEEEILQARISAISEAMRKEEQGTERFKELLHQRKLAILDLQIWRKENPPIVFAEGLSGMTARSQGALPTTTPEAGAIGSDMLAGGGNAEQRMRALWNEIKKTHQVEQGMVWQDYAQMGIQAIGTLSQVITNHHEERIRQIQQEKQERLSAIDAQLARENITEAHRRSLVKKRMAAENRYNKRVREAQRKQAIRERQIAVFEIAVQSAVNAVELLGKIGPAGVALAAGMGAAQTAAVLSQPLPEFHAGGFVGGRESLAVLESGEFVMNRRSVQHAPRAMAMINDDPVFASAIERIATQGIGGAGSSGQGIVKAVNRLNGSVKDQTRRLERVERVVDVSEVATKTTDYRFDQSFAGRD